MERVAKSEPYESLCALFVAGQMTITTFLGAAVFHSTLSKKKDKNVASLERNVATSEVKIYLQEVIQEIMGVLKDRERSL